MAKVKTKKRVNKKFSAKKSKTNYSRTNANIISKTRITNWDWFINILFVALFIYGAYVIWVVDWVQGLSLIVALLITILVIKLVRKFRKR